VKGRARVVATSVVVLVVACGGRSEETVPRNPPPADDGGTLDAGSDGGACACPSKAPNPGDACDCPEQSCEFPPSFTACWRGGATCSADGHWLYDYPTNDACPAELPANRGTAYCNGTGSCEYAIDVGCGPVVATLKCGCVDASWMLGASASELPELCDCTAIATQGVCNLYSRDCTWESTGDAGACRPPR
jgi:hypothetical protein